MRGSLFVDYVRMLRSRKDVNWSNSLAPEDVAFLSERIAADQWYPMESFERMGLAILAEIAGGDITAVKEWGRSSIDGLRVTANNFDRRIKSIAVAASVEIIAFRRDELRRCTVTLQAQAASTVLLTTRDTPTELKHRREQWLGQS